MNVALVGLERHQIRIHAAARAVCSDEARRLRPVDVGLVGLERHQIRIHAAARAVRSVAARWGW